MLLILLSDHKLVLEWSHLIDQKFFELMRILFDFLFEDGHLCDEIGEILAEDLMLFIGLCVYLLNDVFATTTVSRCDLALPDCSPIVFPSSPAPELPISLDIYITSYYQYSWFSQPYHYMSSLYIDIPLNYIMREENHCEGLRRGKEEVCVEWSTIDRGLTNRNQNVNTPKSRFKHLAGIYNRALYIYGGTTIPMNEAFDDPLDIYHYSLDERAGSQWQKGKIKCGSKDLDVVSGHCGVLKGNYWFIFGGTNNQFKCNNFLWRLNLETLQMVKLQGYGEVPSARESAALFFIEKNWLVLYGGVSINSAQINNSFHFYNIQSKNWSKCEGTYIYQAYPRYDPALLHLNNKIYLFGGAYRNIDNEQLYLNDFYQIVPVPPEPNTSPKIMMKRLTSTIMPQPRSGHSLLALGDEHLVLIAGENSCLQMKDGIRIEDINVVANMWLYSIRNRLWSKLDVENSIGFKYRTQFSASSYSRNKIYLFGGLQSYSQAFNDIVELNIPAIKNDIGHQIVCLKCEQKKLFKAQHCIAAAIIQDLVDNIEFPFAAFALLIDNGVNHLANFVNIFYHEEVGGRKMKVLRVQDNAKLGWSDEQFFAAMGSFSAGPAVAPSGIDKKTKSSLARDNIRRQYGYNVKIASLKLGTGFLHISYSDNEQDIRICLFKKQNKQKNKQRYILLHYTFSIATKQCSNPEMNEVRKYIEAQYAELIKDALSQCNVKNTIFIIEPKIQDFRISHEEELQLKVHTAYNDIINGSISSFIALEKAGYNITDCVDVSLRAYIVCLYLKNQFTRISLTVKNIEPVPISTQIYLDKVDKLCKYKYVLQINSVIEFQFKIVQLYYLYDLKKRLSYFNNGLLIYHKNRLISRFKYKLGELIPRKIYKMEGNYNLIRLFGFIELPDHIPVNIFKTNVSYPIMMQKLFSRLKFVSKMFKKELKKLALQGHLKRPAPGRLSVEQQDNDYRQNPDFKPANNSQQRQDTIRFTHKTKEVNQDRLKRGQVKIQIHGHKQHQKQGRFSFGGQQKQLIRQSRHEGSSSSNNIKCQKNIPRNQRIQKQDFDNCNQDINLQNGNNHINKNSQMEDQQSSFSSSSSESANQDQMIQQEVQILHFNKHQNQIKGNLQLGYQTQIIKNDNIIKQQAQIKHNEKIEWNQNGGENSRLNENNSKQNGDRNILQTIQKREQNQFQQQRNILQQANKQQKIKDQIMQGHQSIISCQPLGSLAQKNKSPSNPQQVKQESKQIVGSYQPERNHISQ